MRKISLFLIMLLAVFAPWAANAQVTIGSGTTTSNYLPGYTFFNYAISQQIYTADEINASGNITSISFYNAGTTTNSHRARKYDIYMAHTTKTGFEASTTSTKDWVALTEDDIVYHGTTTVDFTPNTWTTFTLQTAFAYNGTDNLLICVIDRSGNCTSSGTSANMYRVFSTESNYQAIYVHGDSYSSLNPNGTNGTTVLSYTRLQLKNQIILGGIHQTCAKPTNLAADLDVTDPTIATLNWTENGEATSWVLQVATNNTFTEGLQSHTISTTPSKDLTDLTPETTYYARVRPSCSETLWSDVCSFTPSNAICAEIGTGATASSSGTYGGIYTYNLYYAYTQQLYTATELIAAGATEGKVQRIALRFAEDTDCDLIFEVYLGQTTGTSLSSAWISDADPIKVYDGTTTFSGNGEWNNINTTGITDWEWDGTSNIVVAIRRTDKTAPAVSYPDFYYINTTDPYMCRYTTSSSSSIELGTNNVPSANGSTTNQRPEMDFCILPSTKPHNVAVSNITSTSAKVTWEAPAYATPTGYQYQYKYATTPTWPDTWNSLAASITEKTLSLEDGTTYDFRIRATYSDGDSDPVEIQFTTLDACAVPNILEPYVRPGTGTEATVIWNPGYDETNWVLQYATNADFSEGLQETTSGFDIQTIDEVTYIQRLLTGLTAEQTYYARVKANCGDTYSNWSDVVTFTPTNYVDFPFGEPHYSTESSVPFYGYYAQYGSLSQFIIPADRLKDMAGGTIRRMTFHSSTASANWGNAEFAVYVKEVAGSSFSAENASALEDWSTMTNVYSGTLSLSNNQMVIEFTEPYAYGGGNLMIGFNETTTGTSASASWYYVQGPTNSALYAYQNSSTGSLSYYRNLYLPKITFNYLPTPYKYPVIDEEHCTFGATSAHIAWTVTDATPTGYAYQLTASTETAWPSEWTNITTNYVDIPSLTPATYYDFRVKALYGENESVITDYSFNTQCPEYLTLTEEEDFTQNFDVVAGVTSGTTNNLPLCWNYINTSTNSSYKGYPVVYNYSSASKSAPNHLRFCSYRYNNSVGETTSDPQPQYAILPPMENVNGLRMRLFARANSTSSNYDATFHVGVMTDPADATTFFEIGEGYTPASTTYEQFVIPFNGYTGEGRYIAIMVEAATGTGTYTSYYKSVFIDDITVELIPQCANEVEGLAVDKSSITNASATVNWTDGNPGEWQVATKAGDGEWTTLPTTYTTNSAPLSGLTAGTAYQVKVRAYCNANEQGSWCDPVSFTTYCNPQLITEEDAYEENFNSYTGCATSATPLSTYPNDELPDCWRFLNRSEISGTYPMVFLSSNSSYTSSGNCLFFRSSKDTPLYAILPAFENATSALQLTFKYRNESTYDSNGTLYVGYMTNPNDATTFQVKYTCPITTTITPVGPIYFADAPADSYIAFRYTGGTNSNMYLGIDDVVVSLTPTCWQPQNLAASEVTNESAVLTWERHAMGDETAWVLQYGTDNTFATCTEKNVETNPTYTIESGLTAETTYFARVKPACDTEGNLWSEVLEFETQPDCAAPVLSLTAGSETAVGATVTWTGNNDSYVVEYREAITPPVEFDETYDFEDGTLQGWTTISNDNDDIAWAVMSGSGNAHNSTYFVRSTYTSSSVGGDANDWLISPQIPLGGSLSFYAKRYGTSYPDQFQVYVSTTDNNISSFTAISDVITPNTSYGDPYEYDLSAYSGYGYVAIVYTAPNNKYYVYVDDIHITGSIDGEYGAWQQVSDANPTSPYTFDILDEETTYEVRVKGACGFEESDYSNVVSFTTLESCPAPTNFTLGAVTSSTAAFSWTQTGDVTEWHVWVKESTDAEYPSVYITANNTPSLSITVDLTANTTYDVKIAPACDHDKYLEVLEAFTTLCDPETVTVTEPFTEDFDDWTTGNYDHSSQNGVYPDCWYSDSEGSIYPHIINSGIYAYKHSGSYTMYFMGQASTSSYLALPVFTNDLSTLMVSFWMQTESSDYGTLSLGYITNADVNFNTYQVIQTYDRQKGSMIQRHTFLGDYTIPSNATRLVFRWQYSGTSSWYGACIDDVRVAIAETFTKNVSGYGTNEGGYVLLASPLADETDPVGVGMITDELGSEATPATASYDLYSFDQAAALEWQNYRASNFNLVNGTGYLYANKEDVTLTFRGARYTGDGVVNLTYNTSAIDFMGWNLVGNPFATAATPNKPYYRLNSDGATVNAEAYTESTAVNLMEGIFVKATETGQSVTFTPVSAGNGSKSIQLNLNLSENNSVVDNAIVRFDGGSTLEKFSFRQGSSKVYITEEGKDYAVVNAGQVGEIPVSFKAEKNGSYTLSFTSEEVSFSYLHLIDNMTGNDVNLLETPSYTFDARTTDYESRFRLVFATGSSVDGDNFSFINTSGNLCIFGIEGEATVQVIDILGHVLSSETFSGSYEKKINGAPGVYMVRLLNGNDVKVQKVVVR